MQRRLIRIAVCVAEPFAKSFLRVAAVLEPLFPHHRFSSALPCRQVGIYRLCWRSATAAMSRAAEFSVEVGILVINGLYETDSECVAGRESDPTQDQRSRRSVAGVA